MDNRKSQRNSEPSSSEVFLAKLTEAKPSQRVAMIERFEAEAFIRGQMSETSAR